MPADAEPKAAPQDKAKLGIAGLDDILGGGFTRNRLYLLEGNPGTGKTTSRCSSCSPRRGPASVSYTSACRKPRRSCRRPRARTVGLARRPYDLRADPAGEPARRRAAAEPPVLVRLELGETTRAIFEQFEAVKPSLVVLDSLSEIRLLAGGSLRYRRQILALKHYFAHRGATVLMLDDLTAMHSTRQFTASPTR